MSRNSLKNRVDAILVVYVMRWYLRFINVENMLVFSGTVSI